MGVPFNVGAARTLKKTFHYGTHHIEETRQVEGMMGMTISTSFLIDGWDRVDNAYLPFVFKYLDEVDSRNAKTILCRR